MSTPEEQFPTMPSCCPTHSGLDRRKFIAASAMAAAALALPSVRGQDSNNAGQSQSEGGVKIHHTDTAVVFIDPQNEVLSETGKAWPLVHESLKENNTIENMERIFKGAKAHDFEVFISPHYFFPTDQGWKFNGVLEADEVKGNLFGRKGPLNVDGLTGSGADWLERFKPYIEDGKTIVVSPHRVFGPETNDLVLQLRKRKISKIILGGMLANMYVESHMRELIEQGFEVAMVKDATAAPKHPEWGYLWDVAVRGSKCTKQSRWLFVFPRKSAGSSDSPKRFSTSSTSANIAEYEERSSTIGSTWPSIPIDSASIPLKEREMSG